jgi:thioredoxin 1
MAQREMRVAELADLNDQNFAAEVLASEVPVLVDFWGDHCPACRQISPILRDLAGEYAGRLKVFKVHAADNPQTSGKYFVRAMPTVLLFSRGQVRGQLVGARPKTAFVEAIDRVLGGAAG